MIGTGAAARLSGGRFPGAGIGTHLLRTLDERLELLVDLEDSRHLEVHPLLVRLQGRVLKTKQFQRSVL